MGSEGEQCSIQSCLVSVQCSEKMVQCPHLCSSTILSFSSIRRSLSSSSSRSLSILAFSIAIRSSCNRRRSCSFRLSSSLCRENSEVTIERGDKDESGPGVLCSLISGLLISGMVGDYGASCDSRTIHITLHPSLNLTSFLCQNESLILNFISMAGLVFV